MAVSLFEPRTMLEMVNTKYRARSFLRDRFFTRTETFNTETVDIDIVGPGKRKMAAFVNPRLGSSFDERDGYTTHTFKPAYIAPSRITTAEDAMKRLPGETLYSDRGPDARARQILAEDLVELDKQITRREEWMCAQALTTGKITVKGEGVDAEVNFWPSATQDQPTTTLSTLWTSNDANPLTDLRTIARSVAQKSGLTPVEIICGAKAVDCLLDRLKGDNTALNSRRIDLGQINPRELADGVSYVGALRLPNLDVLTYDEYFLDEESNTEKPMIPDNLVIMACRNVRCTRAYGLVNVMDLANNTSRFVVGDRVPNSWLSIRNPAGRVLELKSAPLMIINEIYGFHVIKVA